MERFEAVSELQSRLASLSGSSFPGITAQHGDNSPLERLQNTDLSQSFIGQPAMEGTGNAAEESVPRPEDNLETPDEPAVGGQAEDPAAGSDQPTGDMRAQTPPLKPPSTWTSATLKELKAKLRPEKDSVVTVYRGDIMTVHVPTVPEAKRLCWEFATDGYDIGFGIYFDWSPVTSRAITVHISESSDDEDEDDLEAPTGAGDVEKGSKPTSNPLLEELLPVFRQDSHLLVHGGTHHFPGEGTYLLKFDNSYSLWRNKTLYYRVYYSA